ncbi:MAG: type II toxin-antitoxin system PemK/MazF family toxin [Dehalococcoidia bacterium]
MPGLRWAIFEADLDPVAGAEQKGVRPVLIVSNEEFNQAMPNVTVLPLTSTQRRLYPSELLLPEGKAGQPLESIVMAHQIRTISKQRLKKLLGYLDDGRLQHEIHRAIKEHLDME